MIYRIAETTSTNDDAKRPEYRHGDIVWAERQTAGRGQRGHSWTSPEGENLTFTLVLEPVFLPVGEQFLLSEAVTLALTDTFAAFGIDARIKCRRQKTGRHPHRTQLFGPDPRADDRGHRHQRQPACVRPRTAQPRVDGGR